MTYCTTAPISSIITHAGAFHADEVLGIALLHLFIGHVPVNRTFTPSAGELADPRCLILDLGRQYKPELANLDHHQDAKLPAACSLVLDWCLSQALLTEDLAAELRTALFDRVSDIDRGLVAGGGAPWEFNSIIKGCQNFDDALLMAGLVLENFVRNARKALEDKKEFLALPRPGTIDGLLAVNLTENPLLGWKEEAEKAGVMLMLTPNLRGGFNLISRDTEVFVIPTDESQTFRHAAGFMATYATQIDAMRHAENMVGAMRKAL